MPFQDIHSFRGSLELGNQLGLFDVAEGDFYDADAGFSGLAVLFRRGEVQSQKTGGGAGQPPLPVAVVVDRLGSLNLDQGALKASMPTVSWNFGSAVPTAELQRRAFVTT